MVVGCSKDTPVRTPDESAAMTPASAEAAPPPPKPEPYNYIIVEEAVRTTCRLPNDEEKAPKFDYDQADLRPRGKNILDAVATCLTEGPMKGESITIIGHADPRGSEDYNLELGKKRAEAARDYLASKGLGSDRIRVESRGESVATGTEESSWATDRRVEVRRGSVSP
jgi:peptidoglycan-associated lipoprotein